MTEKDPVRALLEDRGVPPELVEGGLDGLIDRWSDIVDEVEDGYPLSLDDYLNDMDLRNVLDDALRVASADVARQPRERLKEVDARMRAASVATGCLWGQDVEKDDGLDRIRHWWYYQHPLELNEELEAELDAWGLLVDDADDDVDDDEEHHT